MPTPRRRIVIPIRAEGAQVVEPSAAAPEPASVSDAQPHAPIVSITWLGVPGMCCPTEFGMVERELRRLPGVLELSPDLMQRRVKVQHDGVSEEQLVRAAKRSGLVITLVPAADARRPGSDVAHGHDHHHDHDHHHEDGDHVHATGPATAPDLGHTHEHAETGYGRLAIGAVLAFSAEGAGFASGDGSWLAAGLALAAVAVAGIDTFRKGLYALRQWNLNINALMSVAVVGAALLGQWPEAAMVMVLFALAEKIEEKSLDRARKAVASLMAMAPETATVQSPAGWRDVPVRDVPMGSLVRARPGERIALDGTVTSGASAVDQSPITGESVPVDKAAGEEVFAGSINQNGELEYRTRALADDSTLARIVRAVQEAQASRAPTQRFVDTFAKYYTPVVFAGALALAVAPPLLMGGEWATWVYRALVMLVVACPCALVISTPVTVVSGLTAAARRGILVKGGLYLELGDRLRVIALDKTGTLTRGRPTLTETVALQGQGSDALRLAASLASRSDHPVSRAVAQGARGLALDEVEAFTALQGQGVEGRIGGVRYRLGNHRLVEASGAASPALEERLRALEQQGRTAVVLLALDAAGAASALAIFAIADTVRPESREAVVQLQALGLRTVMLTGDNRHTANAIAREVGIDDVRSELLPTDKLAAVQVLADGGVPVGMVGDGINDAPALAKADIGFAMAAAGTDTAIETADVALMDDDPRKLAEFVRLSRRTKRVLWQNIGLALGLKAVFLVLAMSGVATLWMAVFADVGSSLLVVGNGLRLLRARA